MTEFFRKRTSAILGAALFASAAMPCFAAGNATDLPADWQDKLRYGVRAYENAENHVAFDTFSKLMAQASRKYGSCDGRLARILTNMGEVYDEQHQYKYAEQCLKSGLNIARKGYGQTSPLTVPALIDLAQVYVHENNIAKAQPLFKQALDIISKLGSDKLLPYVAVAEADLGSMFFTAGNYALGEPHFKRALSAATKSFGASHKWTTTIGGMYAACLSEQGKSKQAKAVEQAALTKVNETQSPIAIWNTQLGVADQAIADKRFADADTALSLALQAAHQLTQEPMIEALTLLRYGRLNLLEAKPGLAVEKWKAAQASAGSVLGLDDDFVLDRAKELADLEKSQNQYTDAEPLYRRLFARAKKKYDPETDEYFTALTDLAALYSSSAQYPKATAYYTDLLCAQQRRFGEDSETLVPTLIALANASQNSSGYFNEVNDKAEEYLKRASDISSQHFGRNSKELADVLNVLVHYYEKRSDWDKALSTCTQMVSVDEKKFGPNSEETMKALECYAVVLRAAGRRDKAEPIEDRIAKFKGSKNASEN